jgi:hypothetical protein
MLIFTLIQCSLVSPDVGYSREKINAYITDLELDAPVTFGNDQFKIAGAHFQVEGETGVIYDVQYKVYGNVWFCGGGMQDVVDITSDLVFVADSIHISTKTIRLGVGIENLIVSSDVDAPQPGQIMFAGRVGVRLYYRNANGERQVSKSESFDQSNLYCQ